MQQLESYLNDQIQQALQSLNFPTAAYQMDRPKMDAHGDVSINVAMLLARPLKQNPRQIATQIVEALTLDPAIIEKTDIAGPGFINFFIAKDYLRNAVEGILSAGENFGRSDVGKHQKAMVEFVSANPTGPLTVGHGRQAVIGDTVATMLEWLGYDVTREYYFNNAGRQMRVLAESVRCRYLQLLGERVELGEEHYQGEYIRDIAQKILDEHGGVFKENDDLTVFKDTAESEIFADIKKTLAALNIYFDSFFNESDLYENGDIDAVLETFRKEDLAYDKDGAVWFRATKLGLEKDPVIVKSSGEPTYRLPDMAYHRNKFQRGFERLVDIFGSDHIATFPDVLAGVKALGFDSEKVTVLIHQFVTLYEGKEVVKMSTRKANFVTLDELVEDVSGDVTRWFFLMRSMQSHLNFDIQLAKTQSDENPVYYNQYAHARICSILRKAAEKDLSYKDSSDFRHLEHDSEFALIKKLMEFPKMLLKTGADFEPHLLTQYMSDLSTAFHRFYTDCWVITDDHNLSRARLGLCLATKTVLGNGFKVLGVSAPEQM